MWHCEGLCVIVILIACSLNEQDRVQANDILDCKKWWTQCFAREEQRSRRSPSSVWLDASHPYLCACFANWYYEHKYKWYKNIYFQQCHLGNFFEGPSPVDNLFFGHTSLPTTSLLPSSPLCSICLYICLCVVNFILLLRMTLHWRFWNIGIGLIMLRWACGNIIILTTSLPLGVASCQH